MSGRFRDFEHVVRVGALFACGFLCFFVIRWWLVPADFGVYGFFRAGALDDNRAPALVYAGRNACAECHVEVLKARQGGRHAEIGCEACHGPLGRHASGEDETKPVRPDSRATCIRCHTAKAGKPAGFPQVNVVEHAPEGSCAECHAPHHPAIQ